MSPTNGHPAAPVPESAPPGSPAASASPGSPGSPVAPGEARLSDLRSGQAGVVEQMDEGDHIMLIRLKTMGLVPGVAVRVIRGGPRMIVAANGVRIGLARAVARHVGVTRIALGGGTP